MTPAELKALTEAATPGPWTWLNVSGEEEPANEPGFLYPSESLAAYRADSRKPFPQAVLDASGMHTPGYVYVAPGDARLIALAPDLARLCAEIAEVVPGLLNIAELESYYHPEVHEWLKRLSELESA